MLRVKHEFTKYIIRTLFEVNTIYAQFDYETAGPLNDFNTTVVQAYYALYDLSKTLARCIRSRCVLSEFSAEPALPARTGVPLGVYKVAVETTNQYTGSNMSDRQLTADLHYRTAVVKVVTATTFLIRRRRRRREEEQRRHQTKRKVWVRPWLLQRPDHGFYEALMQELVREDRPGFQNFLRMNPALFLELLERVGPRIEREVTFMRQTLGPALRLAITLCYLATGNSYKDLEYGFRVANNTISRIVPETCNAIVAEFGEEFLKVI